MAVVGSSSLEGQARRYPDGDENLALDGTLGYRQDANMKVTALAVSPELWAADRHRS
jgi:hypothetical protein